MHNLPARLVPVPSQAPQSGQPEGAQLTASCDRLDSFRGPTLREYAEINRMVGSREVAMLLGKSLRTVRRWSDEGFRGFPPPVVDVGQRRWRLGEIEQWMRQHHTTRRTQGD